MTYNHLHFPFASSHVTIPKRQRLKKIKQQIVPVSTQNFILTEDRSNRKNPARDDYLEPRGAMFHSPPRRRRARGAAVWCGSRRAECEGSQAEVGPTCTCWGLTGGECRTGMLKHFLSAHKSLFSGLPLARRAPGGGVWLLLPTL